MYTGSCLCGGVRFQIQGELEPIQVCHCSQCRKAQGTPFATNTPVKEAAFQLDSGAELLKSLPNAAATCEKSPVRTASRSASARSPGS